MRARPKAARLLHRELAEPRHRGIVAKIGRHEAEGVAHGRGVADDGAPTFDGDVEPLVRIDAKAVGPLDAGKQRARRLGEYRDAAVGRVDMQPQVLPCAHVGELVERIDGASVHGASACHHRDGPMSAVQSPTNRHGRTRMKARTSAEGDGHG